MAVTDMVPLLVPEVPLVAVTIALLPFQQYLSKQDAQIPLRSVPLRALARSTMAQAKQAPNSGSAAPVLELTKPCVAIS